MAAAPVTVVRTVHLVSPGFETLLLISSVLSMSAAAVGVWLGATPEFTRRIVPVSGAILLLLSLLGVMPELARLFGWQAGPLLMLAGFAMIWLIDRYITPVCPACSHTHDHDNCAKRLHGFAGPLITAALIHSLFDGWTLAAGQSLPGSGSALVAGVLVHKVPETFAYGVILKAALGSRTVALTWALIAQGVTVIGALLALGLASHMGTQWLGWLLALTGGTFLYLGFHAVHGEWRRRAALRTS